MLFWFLIAFLTVLVILLLLYIFGGGDAKNGGQTSALSDLEIYKSQLGEIALEERQGQIDAENAKEARLELARRILAVEKNIDEQSLSSKSSRGLRVGLSCGILLVPILAWGLYAVLGNPDLPARPFSLLMQKDLASLDVGEQLVRTEVQVNRNPQDGIALDRLGDLYLAAGRYRDAVNTLNRSLGLNGESANRLFLYGMALTGLNQGVVDDGAETAFRAAAKLDPENPDPQILLARGLLQNGKKDEAVKLLETFVARAGKDKPWRDDIVKAVEGIKTNDGGQEPSAVLSDEQRRLIVDNVDKLATRLEKNPDDLRGWTMLINAWRLIDKPREAEIAYDKAIEVLNAEDARKLRIYMQEKAFAPALEAEGQVRQ